MAEESTNEATRRQFFRLLGRQTATSAGNLWGTVNALRRTSSEAANELLGLPAAGVAPAQSADSAAQAQAAESASVAAEFRSPYRLAGDSIVILDQRTLPGSSSVIECSAASEVAAAIRSGAIGGGPVLGQLAAHTCVVAVGRLRDRPTHQRRSALRAAAATLRTSRPTQRSIRHALARIEAADEELGDELDGAAHHAVLLAEADALAMAAALDHSALGRAGARVIAARQGAAGSALNLLIHGDGGALAGGLVATSFSVVAALVAADVPLHAWLTEAGPTFEGGRLGAHQLAAAGVPHTVVADSAVSWLFDHRRVDAVLLRADWVCANGDMCAPLGSLNISRLAPPTVPVYACAPASVIDPATASGSDVPPEFRVPAPGAPGPRLDPGVDVVPAALLSGLFTAAGVIEPPFADRLATTTLATTTLAATPAEPVG